MKIRSTDYNKLKSKVNNLINAHPQIDVNKGLSSMRYRWDIYHAAKAYDPRLYDYLNDDNIDTALKSILKERKKK
jgi:hypothetical protein